MTNNRIRDIIHLSIQYYMEDIKMSQLKELINILTGHFDNREQFEKIKAKQPEFPYAQHVNTPCNDKIRNLPDLCRQY